MKNYRIAYANGSSTLNNIDNPRIEEFVYYQKNEPFTVSSNDNHEIRFNNLVIGTVLMRRRILEGWLVTIERMSLSGRRFFDEVVLEEA